MRLLIVCMLIFSSALAQQNDQQLGYQYYLNGEYYKAISIYKQLNKEQFSVAYHTPYFTSLLRTEQFNLAEQLARKVSRLYPNSLNYQLEIGIVQKKAGDIRKSERTFKKVLKKLDGRSSQAISLANTYIQHSMYEDALQVYFVFEENNLRTNFGMQKAQLYAYLGKSDLMIEEYLNLLQKKPKQKSMVLSRIQRFLDNDGIKSDKNYRLVKKALLPYVRNEENRTDFSEILIWLFMQNAQYEMALRQAMALDRRTNSDGDVVYNLAESFLDKQNYQLAIEGYEYIIDKGIINSFFIDANINKLYALTQNFSSDQKDLDEIDKIYKQLINDLGENKSTVLLLSNYAHFQAFFLHDLEVAEQILNNAMNIPQISKIELAECKLAYADVMLLKDNIWEALLYYSQVENAFKENPVGHEAKLRRAKIAYYQGDFQWAQAQLGTLKASTSKLIANDALDLSLLITDNYNLDTTEVVMKIFSGADLLFYQQKYTQSLSKYDSILINFSGHSLSDEIYMRKANIYSLMGEIEMSLRMYEKISKDWSFDILADDAIYKQAKIYDDLLNQNDKAMELYEKILLDYAGSIFTADSRNRYRVLRGDNLNSNE